MSILKIISLIGSLFLTNCLFCWIFTSHWVFGPIVTIVSFLGGLLLISFLGVVILKQE